MSKWEELEKAARAATPGRWMWDSDPIKGDPLNRVRFRVVARGRTITQCYYSSGDDMAEKDAAYIAAANPSAILELLAERDALKAENTFLEEMNAQLREQNDSVGAACAKYEAENERLTSCLKKANDQAEDFERRWYLADMELDRIRAMEPVAWLFQHEETGLTECVDAQQVEWGFEKSNPRWKKVSPLYTLEKP